MKVHVLDVGQGACAILDFGGNCYGIVDCGGAAHGQDPAILRFLRRARETNDSMRILFLLITHLDLDHITAITALCADTDLEGRIEKLYCNDLAYRRLFDTVKEIGKHPTRIGLNPDSKIALKALHKIVDLIARRSRTKENFHAECSAPEGSSEGRYPVQLEVPSVPAGVDLHVWAPSQRLRNRVMHHLEGEIRDLFKAILERREVDDWNTASIMLTVTVAGRRILIAGDATKHTWEEVIPRAETAWIGADIVVAWHHGARLGSRSAPEYDSRLWNRVLGREHKIVCVSCGTGNPYGHPHAETLVAVAQSGGEIYCTQQKATSRKVVARFNADDFVGQELMRLANPMPYIEESGSQCCGDITVEVDPTGRLSVACSAGGCADRSTRIGCCR